ncbi:MAG: hypothetical protein JWR10_2815 [Rubritepida sp.]|nr:hypothetical protein [Rubritepida sp.]
MKSALRLLEMPFLAATVGMALMLALPWAFPPTAADPGRTHEASIAAP